MSETRQTNEAVGVVLFQLGGPDSLDAIEPFLFNLFSDPDIIDFPLARLARPTLARLISSRRSQMVCEHYAAIGGKSPIAELTERQARALESELRKSIDARVFVAMRYWHPLTEEAVHQLRAQDPHRLVLLPLYPQYSKTTTQSSLNEWRRRYDGSRKVQVRTIREFYNDPVYIDAMVENVHQGLEKLGSVDEAGDPVTGCSVAALGQYYSPERVHLVFSAHGVPERVIEAGDPYQVQVEATARLVIERGGWRNPYWVCYQSRVGPGRWLRPSLTETLRALAAVGAERLLVIPISFVTDHLETLSEINIEARKLAVSLGIRQFEMMPALNDSPRFIQALAGLVLRELGLDRVAPTEGHGFIPTTKG